MAEEAKRIGGEAKLRDELQKVDEEKGDPVRDAPYGKGRERRRGLFIDLHGDEDGDPNTREQGPTSTPSTGSTTPTTPA